MVRRLKITRPHHTSDNPALRDELGVPSIAPAKKSIEKSLASLKESVADLDSSNPLLRKIVYQVIIPKSETLLSSINDESGAPALSTLDTQLSVFLTCISSDGLNSPILGLPNDPIISAQQSVRKSNIKSAYLGFRRALFDVRRDYNLEIPPFDSLAS